MSTFKIGDKTYTEDSPELQEALAAIYDSDVRPLCMCVPKGVEMYISRFSKYVVKRMPDTGHLHAPECESFEVQDAETGRGLHAGDAIQRLENGRLKIRLGFPLTRYEGKAVPHGIGAGGTVDAVQGSRGSLTIGALLHLLWDEAAFNKWSPKMAGKRYWGLVRHFLLQAATDIDAKGGQLAEHLLIPEPFRKEKKDEIAERLAQQLAKLEPPRSGVHPMLVLIGELKDLEDTPTGGRAVIKHLPTVTLHVGEDLMKKIKRHFGQAIEAAQAADGTNLVMACTVRKADEKFVVEAATLMMVNREWIPVDNRFERVVADSLVAGDRSFLKVMRYGAPEKHAYANFVLRDTDEPQLNLDIVVDGKDSEATAAKEAVIAGRPPGSWVWRTSQTLHMPPLPPPAKSRRFQAAAPADSSAAGTSPAPAQSTTAPNDVAGARDVSATAEAHARPIGPAIRQLFVASIALSAFLLFLVQPIIAKQLLPWFGGSSAVWITCLVFFQVMLLAGYTYAHLLTTRLRACRQGSLHIALLLASLVFLPIVPAASLKPTQGLEPGWQVTVALLATVGLPYFLLATTGPLLQKWVAPRLPEGTVYRLFALSNLGSLVGLLAFPFAIEPFMDSATQSYVWSAGYVGFVVCVTGLSLHVRHRGMAAEAGAARGDGGCSTVAHAVRNVARSGRARFSGAARHERASDAEHRVGAVPLGAAARPVSRELRHRVRRPRRARVVRPALGPAGDAGGHGADGGGAGRLARRVARADRGAALLRRAAGGVRLLPW